MNANYSVLYEDAKTTDWASSHGWTHVWVPNVYRMKSVAIGFPAAVRAAKKSFPMAYPKTETTNTNTYAHGWSRARACTFFFLLTSHSPCPVEEICWLCLKHQLPLFSLPPSPVEEDLMSLVILHFFFFFLHVWCPMMSGRLRSSDKTNRWKRWACFFPFLSFTLLITTFVPHFILPSFYLSRLL